MRIYESELLMALDFDQTVQQSSSDYVTDVGKTNWLLNRVAVDLFQLAGGAHVPD